MDFKLLTSQIQITDDFFKERISRTIDRHLTIRNWLIGFYIVEYEQNGEDRATYGDSLMHQLSEHLDAKGLSSRNLNLFRQFYNAYPQIGETVSAFLKDNQILQTLSAKSTSENIVQTPSAQLDKISKTLSDRSIKQEFVPTDKLIANLSFSHFVELIKIEASLKRAYYEIEAIKGVWSVRELKRQINSLNFERSAAAKDPQLMVTTLSENSESLMPEQIIKTPYVFDFLGLPDGILGSESALEAALINDLKGFILELGHGFCLEQCDNGTIQQSNNKSMKQISEVENMRESELSISEQKVEK